MEFGFVSVGSITGRLERRRLSRRRCRHRQHVVVAVGNGAGGMVVKREKLVELRDVSYSFGSTNVVQGLDFELMEGEIVCLLGPSGSGKSTILRIVSGLAQPSSGTVLYRGRPFEGVNPGAAIVFQTFALYPWLTVLENVELGIPTGPDRRGRAMRAIDTIGLDGFLNAYPRELSGGMRQRVGFARALAVEPEVLCMDEPFSALDVLTAENLRSELLRLWRGGEIPTKAIFVVTHGIEEAVSVADRIVILQRDPGQVRASFPVTIPHPRDKRSKEFQNLVDKVYTVIARSDENKADVGPKSPKMEQSKDTRRPLDVIDTNITDPNETGRGIATTTEQRRPMLPAVRIGSVAGLLNFIDEEGIDLYRLGQTLQLDVDEIYPIVQAADILQLIELKEGDVMINERGTQFLRSSINERKLLVRESILDTEGSWLVRQIYHLLCQSRRTKRIPQELIFDTMLLKYFSPQEARRQLEIAVEWGRYAELFGYDAPAAELFIMEVEEDDPSKFQKPTFEDSPSIAEPLEVRD